MNADNLPESTRTIAAELRVCRTFLLKGCGGLDTEGRKEAVHSLRLSITALDDALDHLANPSVECTCDPPIGHGSFQVGGVIHADCPVHGIEHEAETQIIDAVPRGTRLRNASMTGRICTPRVVEPVGPAETPLETERRMDFQADADRSEYR